jgi:hypothetical protein
MDSLHKAATLTINRCSSKTVWRLLTGFADEHTIDTLFLQEVIQEDVHNIVGYTAGLKIRDTGRRTAISVKEGIDLTRVTRLASEGGIAAIYATVDTINLLKPSGFLYVPPVLKFKKFYMVLALG